MILVDTNILIDLFNRNSCWFGWSTTQLADAKLAGAFTNSVVVAEFASRAQSLEQLIVALEMIDLKVEPIGSEACFLAGQAFARWIDDGGRRGAMLPDFLIGGHASAAQAAVLTRDPRRFRRYFPALDLIIPDTIHG